MEKKIAIFGGTGFIGKTLIGELLKNNVTIIVASRKNTKPKNPISSVGSVQYQQYDPRNDESIKNIIKQVNYVINLVGSFLDCVFVNAQFPEKLVKISKEHNIKKFIHLSALLNSGYGDYARSKRNGENAVISTYDNAYIVRPGMIFGKNDGILEMLDQMARFSPFILLPDGKNTTMQTVHVQDVVAGIQKILLANNLTERVYEFHSNDIYSFEFFVKQYLNAKKQKRVIINIPLCIAKIFSHILYKLGFKILLPNQVDALKNNVIGVHDVGKLQDLNINPLEYPQFLKYI